ncbi:MAG TPA: hypothetical protein VLG13_00435 [Patescibacteria group bacterium]|nr:hypothetical protein [Patescibacteria group bacterium]
MAKNLVTEPRLERVQEAPALLRSSRPHFSNNEIRGPYPELRIVRQVDYVESDAWNEFLNKVGHDNPGKGKAVALGSMACSIITAQEMSGMLRVHFGDKVFFDRRKILGKMRGLAAKFNRHVELNIQEVVDIRADELEREIAKPAARREDGEISLSPLFFEFDNGVTEDFMADDGMEAREDSYTRSTWESGAVAVKGLDKYSRNAFGLDLSGDRFLHASNNLVKDYFRHEGMQVGMVDPNRTPHLVFFESFPHLQLGSLIMKNVDIPTDIVLHAPTALVNPNGNIE